MKEPSVAAFSANQRLLGVQRLDHHPLLGAQQLHSAARGLPRIPCQREPGLICRLRWHLHELDQRGSRRLEPDRPKDSSAGSRAAEGAALRRGSAGQGTGQPLRRTHHQHQRVGERDHRACREVGPHPAGPARLRAADRGQDHRRNRRIDRFKSRDAYARYNGTAPLPVWSSNNAKHRLSRTGNRQLNAALHRIALTQARWHPPAIAMIERRQSGGDSGREAMRILKRRPSDAVFQALRTDQIDLIPSPLDRGASDTSSRIRMRCFSGS